MKLRLSTVDFPQSLKGMRKESFDCHLLMHFLLIQYFSVANPELKKRGDGGGGGEGRSQKNFLGPSGLSLV